MFTSYPEVKFPTSIERVTDMTATRKTGSRGLPLYTKKNKAKAIKITYKKKT